MKVAICDDDEYFLQSLQEALTACEGMSCGSTIHKFSNGTELAACVTSGIRFDAVFLDVEMPGLSGLETGHRIRSLDKDVIIVYLTNFQQYVFDSFKLEAFDYLIKPIDAEVINDLMARIIEKYREQHYKIHIKWKGQQYALEVNEIVYVESYNRHMTFHTGSSSYKCVGRLDEYEAVLAPYGFLRCHQGFLINMKYVKSIETQSIATVTGKSIEMSQRKRQDCLKSFSEYIARYRI